MKLTYIELEANAEEIAHSRSIGENFTNLLNRAFSGIHIYEDNDNSSDSGSDDDN